MPLTGSAHPLWQAIASTQQATWYDKDAENPMIYLGYPLWHKAAHLQRAEESMLSKIQRQIAILQQRNLTIMGRSLVANSLILSRLWHVTRVTPLSKDMLKRANRMVCDFVRHR
ncbi:hypothetical protein BC940DRAFT_247452, partial [Gongronella butleri]